MEAARGERQYSSGTIRKRLSLYAVMIQICSCQLLHFMAVINFTTVAIHLQWNCQFRNLGSEHYLKCLLHYAPYCFSVALIFLIALLKENIKKQRLERRRAEHTPWSDSETLSRLLSSAELLLVFRISLVCPLPVSPCLQPWGGGVQLKLQSWASHIRP